jgi:hypothetical protein
MPIFELLLARSDGRVGPNFHDCSNANDKGGIATPEKPCRRQTERARALFLTTIAPRGAASILSALTTFDRSGSEPIGAGCFFLAREASHRARRGAPISVIDVHTSAKAARRAAGRSRVDNHLPRAAANSSPSDRAEIARDCAADAAGRAGFPGPFFWVFRERRFVERRD